MLRNCILLATVCLAALVSFVGCDSVQPINSTANNSDSTTPLPRSFSQTSNADGWTVLIYMAADNDLEDDAESIVSTLGQFDYSGGTLNVVAMVDSRSTAGTRVYQTDGGVDLVASDDGEKNTADPAVLEEFVQYGTSQFPSEKTMLIVKAPGYAWRGTCFDETNNDATMSIDGLAGALKGKGLDLLVFDASYMGLLEVSYELKDVASYMVATQSTITDRGMPYEMLISYMLLNPEISPRDLAVDLVDGYTDYYYRDFSTISACDLSKAGAVGEAFCRVTEVLEEWMRDNRNIIAPARDHSEIGLNNAVDQSEYLHDLWVFFSDLEAI
ncbi:MAG: clostripain-related cysteine peptidase, partial [candidate division Zixibacteria bacterium]